MAKMSIDTDVISNTLLPLTKNEISKLNSVISIANSVSFPNGEYNWSAIVGELEDCREQASKYYNWLENIKDKFVNNMNDRVEEINNTMVTEIKKRVTGVK